MTREYRLGVSGSDGRTGALVARLGLDSPFAAGRVILVSEHDEARDAVYVGGPVAGRAAVVTAALAAGKAVLCPLPVALTEAELDQIEEAQKQGGGLLIAPTDLRASAAGREALEQIAQGAIGPLHAVYAAARGRVSETEADVLQTHGWELLDFVVAAAGVPVERLYATGGNLFGAANASRDTLLITLRFSGDLIGTVELSRSLPASFPALQEIEMDFTGALGSLRVEPYKHAVTLYGEAVSHGAEHRLWHAHPVVAMLDLLVDAMDRRIVEQDPIARSRELLRLMAAILKSADVQKAVLLR